MADEYKTPNNTSTASTNLFNDQFSQFLYKSKWTNPETQKKFIALINSIVLSAKDSSAQNLMVNYMKKGLDILNVELQKVDMEDDKIVSVNSEDVQSTDGNLKTESVNPNTSGNETNEKLKSLMERLKNALDTNGMSKEKTEQIIRMTFNLDKGKDKGKKLLLDLFDERVKQIEEACGSKQLNEAKEDVKAPVKVAPKAEKQPVQKPKHKAPLKGGMPKKEEPKAEKKAVDAKSAPSATLNTFKTFFRNYILEDQMWIEDAGSSFSNMIVNTINKYASNPDYQVAYNTKLNSMVSQLGKVYDLDDASEDSVNIKNAKNELEKYAVFHKGWNKSNFESFFRNIIILSKTASVSKIQRFVLKKFNDINVVK